MTEGIIQLQRALALPDAEQYSNSFIKTINSLGFLYFVTGNYSGSELMYELGNKLWLEPEHKEEMAFGLLWYIGISMRQQKFEEARSLTGKCFALYLELGQKWGQGFAHFFMGRIALESGDLSTARPHFQHSVTDFELSGDLWGQALALNSLGSLNIQLGELRSAEAECEKSLVLRKLIKDQWGINSCYLNLGDIARLKNIVSEELQYYLRSYELGRELGLKGDMARAANCLGFAALHDHNPKEALAHLSESLKTYIEMNHTRGICECLAGYAGMAVTQGKMENATKLFGAANAILKTNSIQMWIVDQVDINNNLVAIHQQLDETEFHLYWEQGSMLPIEQAIELALEANHD